AMSIMLRMLEDSSVVLRDFSLENPIRAIREISHDMSCTRRVRLSNGRELSALEIQTEYYERALRYSEQQGLPEEELQALAMWGNALDTIRVDPLGMSGEADWVMKYQLIERYREKHQISLAHPQVALIDLQYHDVSRSRGVFYKLQERGIAKRIVDDQRIDRAVLEPPATTRAKLRGEFIRKAKEKRRDFTVDWVHLKLNDQAQRTVMLKDPFRSEDERVDKLIESL
ncbi:MAG: proteasome accessory factor PafA2 family protein, partial [Acidimicrobiales bacterium]